MNLNSTPKLVSDETRAAVTRLLELVLTEANKRLEDCVPDFKLYDDPSWALIKKDGEQIMFFVTDTGGVLPEGRTDRSTEWVGFWNFTEHFLDQLTAKEQELISVALADRDWPNMRF